MVTYAQECLAQAMPDLQSMLPAQWDHTGDSEIPCDPHWAVYTALDDKGVFSLFMVRDEGRPCGYAMALLHPHLNSKLTLVGTISTYFVEERPVRGLILRRLIHIAREWLLEKGAKQVFVETEYQHSAGRVLERMGFTPVKIGYKMTVLGDVLGPVQ